MTETAVRKAARTLSKRGASKGGKARFAKLSREERQDVGRHAAEGRWGKKTDRTAQEGEAAIIDEPEQRA